MSCLNLRKIAEKKLISELENKIPMKILRSKLETEAEAKTKRVMQKEQAIKKVSGPRRETGNLHHSHNGRHTNPLLTVQPSQRKICPRTRVHC